MRKNHETTDITFVVTHEFREWLKSMSKPDENLSQTVRRLIIEAHPAAAELPQITPRGKHQRGKGVLPRAKRRGNHEPSITELRKQAESTRR